ncbi:MAG: ACT domain-containing protein, partial [Alcanivoracaceae bacterium]|nr:ACT domain-containing protein [Alcanivoracaceae bacterium]
MISESTDAAPANASTARLLVTCPDQPGIISAVSTFLYHHGANITDLDQHSSDLNGGRFFLRLEFQTPDLDCSLDALEANFRNRVADKYCMDWRLSYASD